MVWRTRGYDRTVSVTPKVLICHEYDRFRDNWLTRSWGSNRERQRCFRDTHSLGHK
jgi:hypothetical protein